jgi:hypothetical protein
MVFFNQFVAGYDAEWVMRLLGKSLSNSSDNFKNLLKFQLIEKYLVD